MTDHTPPASTVTSTEREVCPVCMGSGYSNHPDSGEVCYHCKGQGQGLAALHNDKE